MENSNNSNNDFWQVQIEEEIYEADLSTLKEWIKEGRLQATDKVKKANLTWLEAIKVPVLREAFSSVKATTETDVNQINVLVNPVNDISSQIAKAQVTEKVLSSKCYQHPELTPQKFCFNCLKGFCNNCLPTVNNTNICPNCQVFCHSYLEITKQIHRHQDQAQPFGLADLKLALRYPLQEFLSLLVYGVVIGISLLPSIYILIGPIVSIVFIFALVSQVIAQAESEGLKTSNLYTFDITEMNKNFSTQLIAAITIFLTCMSPYFAIQTTYLVKAKDAWVIFSNFSSLFLPKLSLGAVIAIIWAIIYYPLTLLIAHVTKNGLSILNPIIGIKIIIRMKDIYLKTFLMYLVIALVTLGIVFLNRERIAVISGSIPHLMVIGIPLLYINLVIGGIIGRALYKCQKDPNFSLDDL